MIFIKSFYQRANFLFSAISFLLITFFVVPQSFADEFDAFNFTASSFYSHDSNLYRLPSNIQPTATGAERSDTILRNSVGFRINKKYSLQTFKVNFDRVDTSYSNSKFLDFKANNYNAAWLWALTPSLTGVLSSDRSVALVPFQDVRTTASASTTPIQNIRTTEIKMFNMDFSPNNKWHLIGGYTNLISLNSQTFLAETSFTLDSIEGGLKYVFPSQSYISLVARDGNGKNSAFNLDPSQAVGQGYEEKQQELSSLLLITGKSRIVSNLGHISRADDDFSIRDFSGMFGGINYIWDITGKTNLSFGLSRRLSSFQTTTDSYSVSDIFSINSLWYVTPKISIKPNFQIGRRNYKGIGPATRVFDREDEVLTYGVGIDWNPRSTIRLGLSLLHDERSSNVPNLDYSTNIASVNGQLTF